MGAYIRPAEKVEREGRKIPLGDTWEITREQLQAGEELAAVAERAHGKVALLINHDGDFRAVKTTTVGFLGLYAVSAELAATAS